MCTLRKLCEFLKVMVMKCKQLWLSGLGRGRYLMCLSEEYTLADAIVSSILANFTITL